MTADEFVRLLDKVRRTGNGTWIACCPAHEDRNPSMTVRETSDGTILLHCFAGCGVPEITGAVGVGMHELFPPSDTENLKPIRRPFPAADVLEALQVELEIIQLCADEVAAGKALSEEDRSRLRVARQRFQAAKEIAIGR